MTCATCPHGRCLLTSRRVSDEGGKDVEANMATATDGICHAEAVRDAATRFRAAREQGGLRLHSLADFPKGSCGEASELLGQYLSDSGLGTWGCRSGMQLDPVFSHAWVERDGLIVDITADQFPDVSAPVLLTTDRTWHYARFPPIPGHDAASLDWFKSNDNRAAALSDYEVLKRRAGRGRRSHVGSC